MAAFDGPDNQAGSSDTEPAEHTLRDRNVDQVWERVQSWAALVTC